MSLEDIEELKRDAEALGKYYSKDFGAHLVGIQVDCDIYMHDQKNERLENARKNLKLITNLYETIPVDELTGDKRYAPLIVVNSLITDLVYHFDRFLEKPNDNDLREFLSICNAVHLVGNIYRGSFHEALDKIKEHPEGKGFKVKLIGITGREWKY